MAKKKQKTLGQVKKDVQKIFNQYIRLRDKGQPCISCGEIKPLQAGHYHAVSTHDGLRFDPENVHGECAGCNCFNQSHLIGYGARLVAKIGDERYKQLLKRASDYKRNGYKFTRDELARIKGEYLEKIRGL